MNENLPPQLPDISQWLRQAASELKYAGISSPRLDAEIILAHTLRKSRTYLHAHLDEPIDPRHRDIADARLALRLDHTPVAYIIGHKEFYGRPFKVTPATLVPRPESETMITMLHELAPPPVAILGAPKKRLVDVGTGTGCLGITAKLEFPDLEVTLCDSSRHALAVAQANAELLYAEVSVLRSNLLSAYPLTADYMLANLPYVDESWQRSPETNYEPAEALFAGDGGCDLIEKLLDQAPNKLSPNGYLFIEADPRQHGRLIHYAKNRGFDLVEARGFILCFLLKV